MQDSNLQFIFLADMDECSSGNPCEDLAHTTCQNTEGGFVCVCIAGFTFDYVSEVCEG